MDLHARRRAALLLAGLAAILGLAAWGLAWYGAMTSRDLRAQAIAIAAGQPFCVQVARDASDRKGQVYVPVRTADDTSGLHLAGRIAHHHAVLVVGDDAESLTFHWSRVKHRFVEGTYGPFPIVCQPSRRYFDDAGKIPLHPTYRFSLMGRRFAIPRVYRPRAQWPGSMVGYSVEAEAPNFQPTGAACTQPFCATVYAAFEYDGKPFGMSREVPAQLVEEGGALRGLFRLESRGAHDLRYVQVDGHGNRIGEVFCVRDCLHRFSRNGMTFSFRHASRDLPAWRTMQDRVVALHTRFEQAGASGGKHGPRAE